MFTTEMSSFSVTYKTGNAFPTGFAQLLLNEINAIRTNPQSYIPYLSLERYRDYPLNEIQTAERFLREQPGNLPVFTINPLLSEMAQNWVNVQGRRGDIGHGNLSERLRQANIPLTTGTYAIAENIAYGFTDPRDIVVAWVVDYLVPGKGHRSSLFRGDLNQIGIGFGAHTNPNPDQSYRVMVVNDYGTGFASRR